MYIDSFILMVFVIELFLLSVFVFLLVVFLAVLTTQFVYGDPLDTAAEETSKLLRKHRNVLYLLLIFSILFLQKTALN